MGLPGGLISDWMWPDWLSTYCHLPPRPRCQVGAVPGRDVVGLTADDVGVAGDLGELQLVAADGWSLAADHAAVFQQVQRSLCRPRAGWWSQCSSKGCRRPADPGRGDNCSPSRPRSGRWAGARRTRVPGRGLRARLSSARTVFASSNTWTFANRPSEKSALPSSVDDRDQEREACRPVLSRARPTARWAVLR